MSTKETTCTTCAHREVCSKTTAYQIIQKGLDGLSVGLEGNEVVRIANLDWVSVTLTCRHFQGTPATLRPGRTGAAPYLG